MIRGADYHRIHARIGNRLPKILRGLAPVICPVTLRYSLMMML